MELGGGGGWQQPWNEPNYAMMEGRGEETRDKHGFKGRKEGRTNQGEGGAVKLIREAVQARGFVRGGFWDSGSGREKGTSRLSCWAGERWGRLSKKRWKVAELGEKGIPESTESEASAVWRPWKWQSRRRGSRPLHQAGSEMLAPMIADLTACRPGERPRQTSAAR